MGNMGKRAILLDIDGTLIDSNDEHAWAWVDTGVEFGHDIQYDKVRWLIGMGGDKVLPALTGITEDSPEGEKILARRGEIFREKYAPLLQPFEKVRDLLLHMQENGNQLVVATSASDEDLETLLEQAGIDDILKKATSADDAEESKPAPDIVEAALKKAGVGPEQAVMIGDTPYDIAAATRAGVPIIALRCGGWQDDDLRGAVELYDDPADLLARYSASILGKK